MSLRFDQLTNESFTFCPYMVAVQGELDLGLPKPKKPYSQHGIGFSCFDKHVHFIRSHNYVCEIMEWEIKGHNQAEQIEGLFQAFFELNRQDALVQTHKTMLTDALTTLSRTLLGETRIGSTLTLNIN